MQYDAAIRPIDPDSNVSLVTLTSAQRWFISWITDILIYILVINLFDEFVESIEIGSFWISILTAVLMKLLLVILGKVEHGVHHRLHERGLETISIVGAFLVLFFGKLLIIEIINEVFDEVHMHGLLAEASMIITMIVGSMLVWVIFDRLGTDTHLTPAAGSTEHEH